MINWVTKQKLIDGDAMAVTFTIHSDGSMQFYFRNNCTKKITKTNYIMFGVDTERCRIYFQSGTSVNGYKFKVYTSSGSSFIRSKNLYAKEFKPGSGTYDLLFDEEEKLNYIQFDENMLVK